jgi:8-oxo-dGTP pyrophosphatase MutT (NUDIX family)
MSLFGRWRELRREALLDCRVFTVERTWAELPGSAAHDFYRIRCGAWAQIVPVTSAGEIVLIRQYRHGAGASTLEIPGGMVDVGETPEQCAARECLEETGYRAVALRSLGALNPNPALFTNRLHAFYADNVERVGDVQNTDTEHTEVELVPLGRLPLLLSRGAIDHALVAGTLWRFLYERER